LNYAFNNGVELERTHRLTILIRFGRIAARAKKKDSEFNLEPEKEVNKLDRIDLIPDDKKSDQYYLLKDDENKTKKQNLCSSPKTPSQKTTAKLLKNVLDDQVLFFPVARTGRTEGFVFFRAGFEDLLDFSAVIGGGLPGAVVKHGVLVRRAREFIAQNPQRAGLHRRLGKA